MTIKDRMLDAYFGRKNDEGVPVGIYTRYLPRGEAEREARNLGLGIIDYVPPVSMLAPPWHILPGFLSEVRGAEFCIRTKWVDGVAHEVREYRADFGHVYQEVQKDAGGIGSEHISKYYIQSPDDYRVMTEVVKRTVLRSNEAAFKARVDDLGGDGVVMARLDRSPYQKCLIELVGQERFLMDMFDDPDPVVELMNALEEKLDESFSLALQSSAEILWQPDNVTVDMTPPDAFLKYLLPFYAKRSKLAREAGKIYVVHMDGRVKPLRDLIAKSDIHILESVSIPEMGGDLTPEEMAGAFKNVTVFPNVPSNWCMKSDEEVARLTRDFVNRLGGSRPYIFQFSEDIPMSEWKRIYSLVTKTVAGCGR